MATKPALKAPSVAPGAAKPASTSSKPEPAAAPNGTRPVDAPSSSSTAASQSPPAASQQSTSSLPPASRSAPSSTSAPSSASSSTQSAIQSTQASSSSQPAQTSTHDGDIDEQSVGGWLLDRQYELTALELYQEIVENGGKPPKSLRQAFGRIYSDRELLSPRGTHLLGDAVFNKAQQRIAGEQELRQAAQAAISEAEDLRYELNIAKEDLATARREVADLKQSQESQRPAAAKKTAVELNSISDLAAAPVSQSEKRALRSLVYRFLLDEGLKMTAISFADELPGDPAAWGTDVGEDRDPLPLMHVLYRYFYHTGSNLEIGRLKAALKDNHKTAKDNVALRSQVATLTSHSDELETEVHALRKQIDQLREKLKSAVEASERRDHVDRPSTIVTPSPTQSHTASTSSSSSSSPAADRLSARDSGADRRSARDTGAASSTSGVALPADEQRGRKFHYTPFPTAPSGDEQRITQEIERVASLQLDDHPGVMILAESLPHIVKGVLLVKRPELIPLFLCCIRWHPNAATRDTLTRLLFNLIVKPDQVQREMIMKGCIGLAGLIGRQRTEVELLPQCWEQIGDKHEERRILVAESCGSLARFVRPDLRPSLIMSILSQLLDDASAGVRQAVARNFALLLESFGVDEKGRFGQVQETLLRLLYDKEQSVATATMRSLLPMFADWADGCELLGDKVFDFLFGQVEQRFARKEKAGRLYEDDLQIIQTLFDAIIAATPRVAQSSLLRAPFAAAALRQLQRRRGVVVGTDDDDDDADDDDDCFDAVPHVAVSGLSDRWPSVIADEELETLLRQQLDVWLVERMKQADTAVWSYLSWIVKEYVPGIIHFCSKHRLSDDPPTVLRGICDIVYELARSFGPVFSAELLKPRFLLDLDLCNGDNASAVATVRENRSRILPVYIVGVLPAISDDETVGYIRAVLHSIALQEAGWVRAQLAELRLAVQHLVARHDHFRPLVLALIKDISSHPAVPLRSCVVQLFDVVVDGASEDNISVQILPTLITLSNDLDHAVRLASIAPLGNVVLATHSDKILEKISVQFSNLLEDVAPQIKNEVVRTFARVLPDAPPRFRDACILPRMAATAHYNNNQKNPTQRKELADELFAAYRTLNGVVLDAATIKRVVLPGLQALLNDAPVMDSNFKSRLQTMIASMEGTVSDEPVQLPQAVTAGAASSSRRPRDPAALWNKIISDIKHN